MAGQSSRRSALSQALDILAPRIPAFDRDCVLDLAQDSTGLSKAQVPNAAWLALSAHIRHMHTDYDDLLEQGYDADSARFFVRDAMNAVLAQWGCRKRIHGA